MSDTLVGASLIYIVIINATTYWAFWIDKNRARQGDYRISENNLLFLAIIGGSSAALFARRYLRHKTHKQPFSAFLFCIVGIQIGVAIVAVAVTRG